MYLRALPRDDLDEVIVSPWKDWDVNVADAQKYWSAILPKLFEIKAQEAGECANDVLEANKDAMNNNDKINNNENSERNEEDAEGERKLISFNKAVENTSKLLANELTQCDSVCKKFANIFEFMQIASKQFKHFNIDGEQFHYGYGDFAPKYSYEVPTIKTMFANNEMKTDEITFIFKKMNSVFEGDLYECSVYEASDYEVDIISDFIATSFEICNKKDCALKLSLISISSEITGNERFINEFFVYENVILQQQLVSVQDWYQFLNNIHNEVVLKLVSRSNCSVTFYNGFVARYQVTNETTNEENETIITKTLNQNDPKISETPTNSQKQEPNMEHKNDNYKNTLTTDSKSNENLFSNKKNNNATFETYKVYFDWLLQKFCNYKEDSKHAACIIYGVTDVSNDQNFETMCANLVKNVFESVLNDSELLKILLTSEMNVNAMSNLISVLAANFFGCMRELLVRVLDAMLEHLSPTQLYQFLSKLNNRSMQDQNYKGRGKKFEENEPKLLKLVGINNNNNNKFQKHGKFGQKSNENIVNNEETNVKVVLNLLHSIAKRILIAAFKDEIVTDQIRLKPVASIVVLGKVCDVLSAQHVEIVLKKEMNEFEYEGVKCAFLKIASEATNCYKFDDILNYVDCFQNSILKFEIASEAMKCARYTECSLQFYQKSIKIMANQIVDYENCLSQKQTETKNEEIEEYCQKMKSLIMGLTDSCQIMQHFRDSLNAIYFLENVVKKANSNESKALCLKIVSMCNTFWHDRLLTSLEKENVKQAIMEFQDIL